MVIQQKGLVFNIVQVYSFFNIQLTEYSYIFRRYVFILKVARGL